MYKMKTPFTDYPHVNPFTVVGEWIFKSTSGRRGEWANVTGEVYAIHSPDAINGLKTMDVMTFSRVATLVNDNKK